MGNVTIDTDHFFSQIKTPSKNTKLYRESLPTENGDTLVIESAAFEDTGVYLCHVQNNIGSQEMRFHVQVYSNLNLPK